MLQTASETIYSIKTSIPVSGFYYDSGLLYTKKIKIKIISVNSWYERKTHIIQ